MNLNSTSNLDELVHDMRSFINQVANILEKTEGRSAQETADLHKDVSKKMLYLKNTLYGVEQHVVDSAGHAIRVTYQYARKSPWQALVIAGLIAALTTYGVKRCYQDESK
jgi:ElaB/YqjD/DUF883 family membrane-anchored ribosome-binding protein